MVKRVGQLFVLFAGAMLLSPPSVCCLFGATKCCAHAAVTASPEKALGTHSCCKQSSAKSCCSKGSDNAPAKHRSGVMCCCAKTVATPPALSTSIELPVWNPVAVLPNLQLQTLLNDDHLAPSTELSPPLRVRLCVWRI
jgi:hypothetical protein